MKINEVSASLASNAGNTRTGGSAKTPAAASATAPPAPGAGAAPVAPATPAQAAASAAASLISSTYSVSVAGKSYSGAISQSNGQYTIAVANLPGATVTAPSLPAAELALTVKVDTLA